MCVCGILKSVKAGMHTHHLQVKSKEVGIEQGVN